ncbi:MAG: response regulator transcription factor [Saprospiraceae bacterium]|nr:response regulator transcription factor [Saprospiraceae bacterium]
MVQRPKLLLVDDDLTLSPLIQEYLEAREMACTLCHNGFDALELLKKHHFDLCLLDVQMPMKSGFDLAREMVAFKPDVPFLFLTGLTEKEDRIRGFEYGAEDYIVKPFSLQELVLRINVILRRIKTHPASASPQPSYTIGSFLFYPDARELLRGENLEKLSELESKLLLLFLNAADGIVHRNTVLKQLWKEEHLFRDRSLNVFISKLRQYLKADPAIEILNIHGTGYRMIIR